MRSPVRLLALGVLLAAALPAGAQETTSLDGEPALRFLIGHGHLTTYCDGLLWVTATRVRFQGLTSPEHSFDWPKSSVKEFRAADTFGLFYIKMRAEGKTYRVGTYPTIGDWYGDRLAFLVRAVNDFASARAEVERVERERAKSPAGATVINAGSEPALAFAVGAVVGYGWFLTPVGRHPATVWVSPAMRAGEAYGGTTATSWGWLEITADRVRFREESGTPLSFDYPKSELEVISGVGGYPRVVVRTSDKKRFTFFHVQRAGENITYLDDAPILQALGPGYGELLARLQPKPKPTLLLLSSPGGAEVFVNDERRGTTSAEGTFLLRSLEPAEYRLRLRLAGYQDWIQVVRLELGEERKLEVSLTPVEPPKPEIQPLSLDDVVRLLEAGVTPVRLAAIVQERGVNFALTPASEARLRALGATDALLLEIAKAKK